MSPPEIEVEAAKIANYQIVVPVHVIVVPLNSVVIALQLVLAPDYSVSAALQHIRTAFNVVLRTKYTVHVSQSKVKVTE